MTPKKLAEIIRQGGSFKLADDPVEHLTPEELLRYRLADFDRMTRNKSRSTFPWGWIVAGIVVGILMWMVW